MMSKILVVDDEPELVKAIEIRLRASGYQVEVAYDGEEGIKKAMEFKPDLIILDIVMPKISGYEVCKILKSNEETRHIPILILTASQQRELEKECLALGAKIALMKPFETEELLLLVKQLLKNQGGGS
ncbi:MAG TPA: response regulator [Candidatus Omnitrophica bacterium]|nr:response regulator [Candidatus Omnitrophota bacterium]